MDSMTAIRWEGLEVCDVMDENLVYLLSMLATTTPVGVVPLLGGVAKVFWHLPLLAWVVISG
jgi:hypothetical protein